jgi:hypothetical protein
MMKRRDDQTKFAGLMKALAEVFDGSIQPSPLKIELYFKALEQYPIEKLELAVSKMIKERAYSSFPKPAKIRENIESKHARDGALKPRIEIEAWLLTGAPYPQDPAIQEVIKSYGGARRLGMTPFNDLKFLLRDLEDRYETISLRHPELLEQEARSAAVLIENMN